MDRRKLVLIFAIVLLFLVNYRFIDGALERVFLDDELKFVDRVIDGDTVVMNGTSVRLLGINSPERGEEYYLEAKEFLEDLILNRSVRLEYGAEKYDKYDRVLGYVFVGGKNVNLELVEEGFANVYLLGYQKYEKELDDAWEKCLNEEINLCEKSVDECAGCVVLEEFDYGNQRVAFSNVCGFDCSLEGWEINDEGRKKFVFEKFVLGGGREVNVVVGDKEDTEEVLYWKGQTYVWTDSGDSLFLRDEENKLVLWDSY